MTLVERLKSLHRRAIPTTDSQTVIVEVPEVCWDPLLALADAAECQCDVLLGEAPVDCQGAYGDEPANWCPVCRAKRDLATAVPEGSHE